MKRWPVIALAVIIALFVSAGCKQTLKPLTDKEIKAAEKMKKAEEKEKASEPTRGMWGESKMSPERINELKKEIEKGFNRALVVWVNAKDAGEFENGLAGNALKELKKQYEDELARGKIKIRVHDDREIKVVTVKEESAAISYKYVDNGYYVDPATLKSIGKPIGKKREWLIGMAKEDGVWKIADIATLKPKGTAEGH